MTLYNSQGGALAVSVGGVYYFTDPSSMEQFDRKRTRNEQATGNRNNTVDIYDGASEVKLSVKKNMADTDGVTLFPIIGAGATLGLPTLTTIIYADENRTMTCANALCSDYTITGELGKPWLLEMNFLATTVPVRTAGYGLTRPTFAASGNYLYWRDITTFFSAAATSTNCQKFMMKILNNLDPFTGGRADGYAIPTIYTPGSIEASGGFTMQMLGFADYDLYLAACGVAADIGIVATPFCAVSPKTVTLTCKAGIYDSAKPVRALKKASLEEFTFMSGALQGANQAVITAA